MCWHWELELSAATTAPGEARHEVTAQLSRILALPAGALAVDDVELVLTELTSNAVRAQASGLHIVLDVHREGVRIAVTDDGQGWPQRRMASPDAVAGRGLAIVDSLSQGWGVTPATGGAKTVWALLALSAESIEGLTCDH